MKGLLFLLFVAVATANTIPSARPSEDEQKVIVDVTQKLRQLESEIKANQQPKEELLNLANEIRSLLDSLKNSENSLVQIERVEAQKILHRLVRELNEKSELDQALDGYDLEGETQYGWGKKLKKHLKKVGKQIGDAAKKIGKEIIGKIIGDQVKEKIGEAIRNRGQYSPAEATVKETLKERLSGFVKKVADALQNLSQKILGKEENDIKSTILGNLLKKVGEVLSKFADKLKESKNNEEIQEALYEDINAVLSNSISEVIIEVSAMAPESGSDEEIEAYLILNIGNGLKDLGEGLKTVGESLDGYDLEEETQYGWGKKLKKHLKKVGKQIGNAAKEIGKEIVGKIVGDKVKEQIREANERNQYVITEATGEGTIILEAIGEYLVRVGDSIERIGQKLLDDSLKGKI